jgi:excisionase family DNA binding protein
MDVEEALRRAPEAEEELRREGLREPADLLEALRQAVEAARAAREKRAYKVGQAAKVIGVHRNTVRGWIERGLLRATRAEIGDRGDYLIPYEEVARAARAHRVSMDADPLTEEQATEYEAVLDQARTARLTAQRRSRRRQATG